MIVGMIVDCRFDPRPCEGATCCLADCLGPSYCFDPRPCEGATHAQRGFRLGRAVSIRAPVRGRPAHASLTVLDLKFRSAPL